MLQIILLFLILTAILKHNLSQSTIHGQNNLKFYQPESRCLWSHAFRAKNLHCVKACLWLTLLE